MSINLCYYAISPLKDIPDFSLLNVIISTGFVHFPSKVECLYFINNILIFFKFKLIKILNNLFTSGKNKIPKLGYKIMAMFLFTFNLNYKHILVSEENVSNKILNFDINIAFQNLYLFKCTDIYATQISICNESYWC